MLSSDTQKDGRYLSFRLLALGLLSVRIIQGFIYWGGGSRRFIYAPEKLDPTAANWMANKFQTAMPGALFGFDHIVSYMLQHFWLLYPGVILFSLAELVAGLFLMLGLFTRFSAFLTMVFSVILMILFGWQGATCIDEWTMAACNLAMGTTLFLCGSSEWALDNAIYRRKPRWQAKSWLRWVLGSLPLPLEYNKFKTGSYGIQAVVGAAATIILPPVPNPILDNPLELKFRDASGHTFTVPVSR